MIAAAIIKDTGDLVCVILVVALAVAIIISAIRGD